MVVSIVIWVRNPFGVVSLGLLGAALVAAGNQLSVAGALLALVGATVSLNALTAIRQLYGSRLGTVGGQPYWSDANVSRLVGLPAWFWATGWLLLSVALLKLGLENPSSARWPRNTRGRLMGHFAFILMALPGNALLVDFRRRGYHGERVPLLSPRESIRRIKTHFVPFVLMTVTTAIGGFIGILGMYAACIGVFVTMPAGHAVGAHALAQWDKLSAP